MSKFKPGLRVVVIDGDTSELRHGVINASYEDVEIAIVKFDDGNVEKVSFDCLGIEPETKVQEEKPNEPVEKSEITITPEEFKKISAKVITKEVVKMPDGGGMLGLAFSVFVAKLHRALFFDAVEND